MSNQGWVDIRNVCLFYFTGLMPFEVQKIHYNYDDYYKDTNGKVHSQASWYYLDPGDELTHIVY